MELDLTLAQECMEELMRRFQGLGGNGALANLLLERLIERDTGTRIDALALGVVETAWPGFHGAQPQGAVRARP